MAQQDSANDLPPYVPFATFMNLLDRLESAGVPHRIDRTYWTPYYGGSIGVALVSGLRFLGLIDSQGEPQDGLDRLVPKETRPGALAELLRSQYAPIFQNADPARATRAHLDQEFKKAYSVDGDTRRKAVSFFLKCAEYAGLPLSSYVGTRASASRTKSAAPRPKRSRVPPSDKPKSPRSPRGTTPPADSGGSGDSRTISLKGGAGTVTLVVRANWLLIDTEQRAQLLKLVDMLNEIEAGLPGGDASRPEATTQEVIR